VSAGEAIKIGRGARAVEEGLKVLEAVSRKLMTPGSQ